jgi:hypothetical protein
MCIDRAGLGGEYGVQLPEAAVAAFPGVGGSGWADVHSDNRNFIRNPTPQMAYVTSGELHEHAWSG